MKIRKVAVIVFYDNKKRILLQGRKTISRFGEEWGFFGGGIEDNETPEETIFREIKEELNFDLKDFKYIGNYKEQISDEILIEMYVFISPLPDLSKLSLMEGDELKLFSLEEAEKLKIAIRDKNVIRELKKIL